MDTELQTRQRVFDWRFIVALIIMALTVFVIWDGLHAASERDELARENSVTTQQNTALLKQLDQRQTEAAARDAAASRERATLLAQMRLVTQRADQSAADLKALLQYLKAHGIQVPTQFVYVPLSGATVTPKAATHTSPPVKGKGHKKH
jgi:hypothetical protein